jgi:hypothetical protein
MWPWVLSRVSQYSGSENIKELIFPGNKLFPFSSTYSYPIVLFRSGFNWLYSTFIVRQVPSFLDNLHIAPTASFGTLGTVIEFISKFFLALTFKKKKISTKYLFYYSKNRGKRSEYKRICILKEYDPFLFIFFQPFFCNSTCI